ncbi:HlyD family efflux transporter periplasmic adaptor subunit [Pikeienuella piscinae]|uniref:HlyD family efflux transporter periplasmic adaptor subunit n=1 Tax=Pikeienuella piscinae TaxID=2748098 RepID=A0A7M3T5D6_9RHOB|nr:HlyD family efflux transporter periplasmic adaptor subunit [Pikeienuella piscinae]QIE57217.1 HlyD family efflux transporter periplasmic adaptor subunit [Pikeienuella piscinae]
MRFLMRSLTGFALFAAAIGLVAWGGWRFAEVMTAKTDAPARGAAAERVFTVDIGRVALGPEQPVIAAYGEIRSWRTLELRASVAGRVVELSNHFRDGAEVAAGDLLFRIDPEDYAARVADAEAAIRVAEADLAEARQAVEVARLEERAAKNQRTLRESGLERRRTLLDRGVATRAEVEEAEMALAAMAQVVASRSQALIAAEIRIERAALQLEREQIAAADARRILAETAHRAPFDGLVSEVSVVLGGLVAANEKLGALIDPGALEAVFRVSNAEFTRLLDDDGRILHLPVEIRLNLDEKPLTAPGVIERAGAVIGAGETGRLVYARLDLSSAALLRPGDFVSVAIREPELADVARLPASAVNQGGEILLIDGEDRLRPLMVEVLRRQGDEVLVGGAPEGARYLRARAPQLGAGVRVKALDGIDGDKSEPLVSLDPDRQRRLIVYVEGAAQMPIETRDRLLEAIRSGRAPAGMVERLEARMGRSG